MHYTPARMRGILAQRNSDVKELTVETEQSHTDMEGKNDYEAGKICCYALDVLGYVLNTGRSLSWLILLLLLTHMFCLHV